MPLFKFEDFIFDSTRHNLVHRGAKVAIRPKASKLLSLLIKNKHRILSKDEIMSSIWGSDYARDHLLFQLIGELRKSPLKNEYIRTQPNEGYQWNVTTKIIDNRFSVPKLIAASSVAALVCLSLMSLPILDKADTGPAQAFHLPAYSALSKGIVALESGEKNKAIEWFEFALIENPDSVESSIFLAETLYQQNRLGESSKYLKSVLESENLSSYNKATATNILSQISERQGKFIDALRYAQKSAETKVAAQCSVDFVEQRIDKLKSRIAMSPIRPAGERTNLPENVPIPENYVSQCNELKSSPVETSMCLPFKRESAIYALRVKQAIFATA